MSRIKRTRGDTIPISITFADQWTGQPLDFTGCTAVLTVDPRCNPVDNSNNIMQLVAVIPDPLSGELIFPMADSDADHVGAYFFDVQVTYPNGTKKTRDEGPFTFDQDISK